MSPFVMPVRPQKINVEYLRKPLFIKRFVLHFFNEKAFKIRCSSALTTAAAAMADYQCLIVS